MLTASEYSQRARLGALGRLERHPIEEMSRAGQAGLANSLRQAVVAEAAARGETLDEAEVARRLDVRRQRYFRTLALRSARVRSARRQAGPDKQDAAASTSAASLEANAGVTSTDDASAPE